MQKTLRNLLLMILASALVTGCGYRPIVRDSEAVFGENKTVSIPIFENKTYKPNLENVLLNYMVEEFAKRKGLRITADGGSDYTMTGEVLSYAMSAVSYTALDIVREYRASMNVVATFRKNSTQRVLWKKEFSWSQDFPISTDIAIQQNTEDAVIQEICRHLAQQIYLKTLEDF